jgi:hypothetical protein
MVKGDCQMKALVKSLVVLGVVLVAFSGPGWVSAAEEGDEGGVKIGSMVIKAVPGTRKNLVIKSSAQVTAVFTDVDGNKEYYIGETGIKLGVDFSFKDTQTISYGVFSLAGDYRTGSYGLAGKYFGQRASVTAGAGVGVAVLLGGLEDSFSLQPLALETSTGAGVAAGLGYLYLQKDESR